MFELRISTRLGWLWTGLSGVALMATSCAWFFREGSKLMFGGMSTVSVLGFLVGITVVFKPPILIQMDEHCLRLFSGSLFGNKVLISIPSHLIVCMRFQDAGSNDNAMGYVIIETTEAVALSRQALRWGSKVFSRDQPVDASSHVIKWPLWHLSESTEALTIKLNQRLQIIRSLKAP